MGISKSQKNNLLLLFVVLVIAIFVIYWLVRIDQLKENRMREICEKEYGMTFLSKTSESFVCLLAKNGSIQQIEIQIKK